jgi:heterodisulfide reductase subunit C
VCTDLQNDPANCGTCSSACPSGDSCKSGSCVCM